MISIPLPFQALRHRFLWRQRAPIGPGEIRRIERWLATARVFLAISALVAIRMDPGEIRYSFWAYGLLAFYIAQGVIVILLLRRREQSTFAFRRLVHAADIVWPALISIFATGQANPFFLFFVFVLAAAAYRWGSGRNPGYGSLGCGLLWLESLAFSFGFFDWVDACWHICACRFCRCCRPTLSPSVSSCYRFTSWLWDFCWDIWRSSRSNCGPKKQ